MRFNAGHWVDRDPSAHALTAMSRWVLVTAVVIVSLAMTSLSAEAHSAPDAHPGRDLGQTSGGAPWLVSLVGTGTERDGEHDPDRSAQRFCSGTLVSHDKIVTAAHCVVDPGTGVQRAPSSLRAVVGKTKSKAGDAISRIWAPPVYENYTKGADVAVLTLARPNANEPLPLVAPDGATRYAPGNPAKVVKFAGNRHGMVANPHALFAAGGGPVDVRMRNGAECARDFANFDPASMVCAQEQRLQQVCAGDSGSPLIGDGQLIGVVSWGVGCGRTRFGDVYTKLLNYRDQLTRELSVPSPALPDTGVIGRDR